MNEHPILFNTAMVQAILDGRKTQTRRVVKPQPIGKSFDDPLHGKWLKLNFGGLLLPTVKDLPMHSPYGQIGDRLWVRETYGTKIRNVGGAPHESYAYKADNPDEINFYDCNGNGYPIKWKPSIHMPRKASRIQLEITNIRVELLNDISEADCIKEGVGSPILRDCKKPKFMQLWESINGAGSWDKNPWVWVIEFKVIQGGAV